MDIDLRDAVSTIRDVSTGARQRRGWIAGAWAAGREWLSLALAVVSLKAGRGARISVGSPGPSTPRKPIMMIDDLRHALRRLRAKPGSAILASAMLALAIGITSAMFTVVDALILSPAPFRDPSSFVWLGIGRDADRANVNLPLPVIKAWSAVSGFAGLYAVVQEPAQFGTGEAAQVVGAVRLSPGLLDDLGVKPILGRTFLKGEGRPGTENLVILSESVWRAQFSADPLIVGTQIPVSGVQATVIGVLPASFAFPFANVRVWRPLDLDALPPIVSRRPYAYAYARLASNVPRDHTARQATDIARFVDPSIKDQSAVFRPVTAGQLDSYSTGTVTALAASVGLVFLVLCVNVTNLMLARLGARRREFALCSALGASRGRLLRQAIWEQVLIGAAAVALGLAGGATLVGIARTSLPANIVNGSLNPLDLDLRAVLATAVLGGMATVLAGALPAWIGTRGDVSRHVQMASRSATPERSTRRTTTVLLVAEVAIAVALSVAAGIQLRSFLNLLHEDRGLDADRLVTFRLGLPAQDFADGATRYAYVESLRAGLRGRPGVDDLTLSGGVPPSASALYFYDVLPDTPGAVPVNLVMNGYYAGPDFFRVLGIRILEGRPIEAGDAPESVVISRSMAAALWPSASAVGHTLSFRKTVFRVVGVAADIRNPLNDPRRDQPEIYEPLLTPPAAGAAGSSLDAPSVRLTVRCGEGCPPPEVLRAGIAAAAPRATVGAGRRVSEEYAAGLERPRSGAVVAIAFAAIGLLAMGAGLFAVLTRVVLQRQREFGIRLALGAAPTDLRRLVYGRGVFLLVSGLAAGIGLAWLVTRVLASIQYQVQIADPVTWTAVIAVMVLTMIAACWRPARQAMGADPLALLRDE